MKQKLPGLWKDEFKSRDFKQLLKKKTRQISKKLITEAIKEMKR